MFSKMFNQCFKNDEKNSNLLKTFKALLFDRLRLDHFYKNEKYYSQKSRQLKLLTGGLLNTVN
jgi:hypothetical protein